MPTIVKLKETAAGGAPEKMWEYECTIDDTAKNRYQFPSGGNMVLLPDSSLFVNMGGSYSKFSIITPQKQLLWSALPERYDAENKAWVPAAGYRASIIKSRAELEQLIWNNRTSASFQPVIAESPSEPTDNSHALKASE
jgi:hypothetical protein